MTTFTIQEGNYSISTDQKKLDLEMLHDFLSNKAYWSRGLPEEVMIRSIEQSLCFGLYQSEKQVGFARIITDYATIAYLGDVFILEEFRGKGLSKWLMQTIMEYPDLQGLRRWILLTGDAHGLYKQFGWEEIKDSSKWMEIYNPEVYS